MECFLASAGSASGMALLLQMITWGH